MNWVAETIMALRGGPPEKCDFCGQPYTEERYPTPDEGGEWACNECWERWDREDAARIASDQPEDAAK